MRYKITKQNVNNEEILFAECNDINDAKMFINNILSSDEKSSVKPMYRIFENNQLAYDVNCENYSNKKIHAQYADGDCNLPSSVSDPFNVIIANQNSEIIIAKFIKLKDAKMFVRMKSLEDKNSNTDVIYYIFDGDKLIEKSDQATLKAQRSCSKETKHLFRPSPFVYRFRPRGAARGVYNTGDDNDDNNKKD